MSSTTTGSKTGISNPSGAIASVKVEINSSGARAGMGSSLLRLNILLSFLECSLTSTFFVFFSTFFWTGASVASSSKNSPTSSKRISGLGSFLLLRSNFSITHPFLYLWEVTKGRDVKQRQINPRRCCVATSG